MSFFQDPPVTEADLLAAKPLELSPEEVQKLSEEEWYARAYQGDKPQLTLRAVAMGTFLGFFLSFTNIYIGLKTGWFLGVALTACIVSFAMSTFLNKSGVWKTPLTILENNCMQSTASSAGYATGNSLVSAIPAMLLLTVTEASPGGTHQKWYVLALWVFFLAILGVSLAIPLKRSLINRERLKFPSGTAAAATLQSFYSKGSEAILKARVLGWLALVSALWKILTDLEIKKTIDAAGKVSREALVSSSSKAFDWVKSLLPQNLPVFRAHVPSKPIGNWNLSDWNIKLDHSAVLVAAGMIVGLRTTVWMVIGGLFLAFDLGPHAMQAEWTNALGKTVTAVSVPGKAWKEIGLWLGAPLMVAHGLTSFAGQWKSIARSLGGLKKVPAQGPNRDGGTESIAPPQSAEVEVPTWWFLTGAGIAGVGLVTVGSIAFEIPPLYGILAVFMSFFLGMVSCRVTGETDITPGGAMGKLMQLTYGKLIPQSSTANLMTASITSGSGLAAADLLNDLKSGYLLGANPRRQFGAQALGILTGTIASILGFFLLIPDATKLTGVDGKEPPFPAPGAQQWKAVAELFKYGVGNLHPMARTLIFVGLGVGITLALLEMFLPRFKKWIPSASGFGLGLILPFTAPLAMFLGAVIAMMAERWNKAWAERYIVPISAGTIAGESIVGVIVAGINNFVLSH